MKTDKYSELLEIAKDRGKQIGIPYSGLLYPTEAHELCVAECSVLVDVRTTAERFYVGHVPYGFFIEWQSFPSMDVNIDFSSSLNEQIEKDLPILFLCRSGVRSHHAASVASEMGFDAYNILEGFEGDLNSNKQRNTVNGWRAHQLPWIQS